MIFNEFLKLAIDNRASDLHLSAGAVPKFRVDGDLLDIDSHVLSADDLESIAGQIMPANYFSKITIGQEVDFCFDFNQEAYKARFRVNAFWQLKGISLAIRCLPSEPPSLSDLGLSWVIEDVCKRESGLVLVTGPTGSGKSTTLAAMVDYINTNYQRHILTIEDPIEYLHYNKRCLVQQREVHTHVNSFGDGLYNALREDPDYILIGEVRDLKTIKLALTAAETGHLVLASLHTGSVVEAVERVISTYPEVEQPLARKILASGLQAVISQRLFKRVGGGRVAAEEVMVGTDAVRNLIRNNKSEQLYSVIQASGKVGMITLLASINGLTERKIIDPERVDL